MTQYLSTDHSPPTSDSEKSSLAKTLEEILTKDLKGDMFALLGGYQQILADNCKRQQWDDVHQKLSALFMAGKATPLDGPMIGSTVSIRDSDYFRETARELGHDRSAIANIEWMATAWNLTFSDTGLWMGKTFEPVSQDVVAYKTKDDPEALAAYSSSTTRIGRNYFREPPNPNLIQGLGLPALTEMWRLRERPTLAKPEIFDSRLTTENAEREINVPYSMTGGLFLADIGSSVVPEMQGKPVYQLNYRWPRLEPAYPMTRLVDELVQIGEGIYLGQLVFASKNYAFSTFEKDGEIHQLGKEYEPHRSPSFYERFFSRGSRSEEVDYGYQNNGFFLMMDPAYAKQIYADDAFPQLRPRPGESGYLELGYDQQEQSTVSQPASGASDGWKSNAVLQEKFTTLILESSPKTGDREQVADLLQEGESVLQMLKRISDEITAQTRDEDNLKHFEKLNRLFRCGVAPTVKDGLFQRKKEGAYNTRINGDKKREWYGAEEPLIGLDYYYGANLNLHCGFGENFRPDPDAETRDEHLFPSILAARAESESNAPNLLNEMWRSIGKYIFPWAGKSFEQVSGRKLSMLLDESDDLARRYPARTKELKYHLASAPHYKALLKNQEHFWKEKGRYAPYLKNGSWDNGMLAEEKAFWVQQASEKWIFGNNLQDSRVLAADPLMRIADMNYGPLDPAVQASANSGPSPFVRQGYVFLGAAGQESILPMNSGSDNKKEVFQFHYRYPMIGGPAPIGYCLDELVEIADGLFLGQLIYATQLNLPYHSSVDPAEYKYQLFGYFLLLDDDWQRHRLAIKLDTLD
ncbi:MAG: hypothetical protein L3J26_08460 [Candidatus Polarisedimenticolaceae bacterium]|nr:hypothetical protein [Candidatus Polarisedimenticolaceae bacterium]